ncbi:hypothetical protein HUK80_12640 [Flavobacterium sp. MAH-1]|uniref:MG2 domain-containing protein n=1 Tax=Flavobacterium agri TaxID=2743471 RepID=A0A7Y8Y3E3_9FLAO|nr:hypothetical protein [Flavobacterium agri]NUY81748.1 hypothetical protein [Flavobacterium agri]NYA71772.1 hypothetical protein [Flavobacterium agri]
MTRLTYIRITFFLIFSGCIQAQQNKNASVSFTEKIKVHVNASALVSGETLYYKMFCVDRDGKPSTLSRIAYVTLVSSDKKAVFTQKLLLENGSGEGDFFIPASLASGMYKLIGYTRWMVDKPASLYFQTDLAIVDPFTSSVKNALKNVPVMNPTASKSGEITLAKNAWTQREKVTLGLKLPNGNYALSVRKKDTLSSVVKANTEMASNEFKLSEKNNLPEVRGEIISGKVTSKNAEAVNDIVISLSIPGKNFATKIARTRADGSFIFTLENAYLQKEAVVQIVGDKKEAFEVQLDGLPQPDFSTLQFPDYPINAFAKNTLREHAVASQIENAYHLHRKDSIRAFPTSKAFYEPSGTVFALDAYTRFPTVAETITEVVEETYYTKKDGKYELHVREHLEGYDPIGASLVIVDGIWLPDPTELFDYPAKNIEKFTIIPGYYYLGSEGFNGLISVATKDGNYEPKSKGGFIFKDKLPRPFAPKEYFTQDYSAKSDERIPDYRYQLAWIPNLDSSKTEVSFYASDVKGTFEAVVEGVSQDGLPVFSTIEFEVK